MKYWYNEKLDCFRMSETKPKPWIRLNGEVCEWRESTEQDWTAFWSAFYKSL